VDRGSDNPVVPTGSIGGFHKKRKEKEGIGESMDQLHVR
jgi:hypothetical protein